MNPKRNFNSIDLCKFIAAIFGVAIHANQFECVIVLALCFTLYFIMEKMKDVKGFTWLKYGF